jgi:hypothetical protein
MINEYEDVVWTYEAEFDVNLLRVLYAKYLSRLSLNHNPSAWKHTILKIKVLQI